MLSLFFLDFLRFPRYSFGFGKFSFDFPQFSLLFLSLIRFSSVLLGFPEANIRKNGKGYKHAGKPQKTQMLTKMDLVVVLNFRRFS